MKNVLDVSVVPAALPRMASHSRAADFLALTKPRLNLLVLITTLGGLYLGAPDGVAPAVLFHTLVGTALVAAGALVFTLAVGLQLLLGAALLPVGLLRGTTEGIDSGWVRSLSGVGLRVAAVSVLGALIGFSIATIGRNTAAALGIAFGYLAIVENAIRGLRPRWTPWLLGDNIVVVITNQPQSFPLVDRSTLGAATLLACYTLVLVAVAVATFRRRDIA